MGSVSIATESTARMKCAQPKTRLLCSFVLLLHTVAAVSANSTFSIQKFEDNPIAYVENVGETRIVNSDWSLLVYYDLQHYFEEFYAVRDGVQLFRGQCIGAGFDCAALTDKFEARLRDIEEKNKLLMHDGGVIRPKRQLMVALGLSGLAMVGGALYNYLTESEGDDYAQMIEDLKSNQNKILEMINQQRSVIEMSTGMSKNAQGWTQRSHEKLRDTINVLDRAQKDGWQLHNVAMQYMIAMESYAETQNRIIDAVMTVHNGNLRPTLISPTKMREQIDFIRAHLGPEFTLPRTITNVYQMAKVKSRLVGDKLIFRVAIPVLRVTSFQIWRIIPIPQAIDRVYMEIRPTTEYWLVNGQNETYYDLSKLEFNACSDIDDELICRVRNPLYTFGDSVGRCEMELIRNASSEHSSCPMQRVPLEERWTQLNDMHSWIFALATEKRYNVTCKESTQSITLCGTGRLYLNGNCSFAGDTMHITTHHLETKMMAGYVVSANISVHFNRTTAIHDMPLALTNTTALDDAVEDMRKNSSSKLLNISVHDWHHYGLIYGLIVAVVCLYVMRKQKKSKSDGLSINQIMI